MTHLAPEVIPLLGNAYHMTADDHVGSQLREGQQWHFSGLQGSGYDMPSRPAQPQYRMPDPNHLANRYPVFAPTGGNNLMVKFPNGQGQGSPYGSVYGKQDPVQEAVVKLAEMGVKSTVVKQKRNRQQGKVRESKGGIFRVGKR